MSTSMQRMKRKKKFIIKEQMKIRFFSLIYYAYVRILCGKILQLSYYLSVESLLLSPVMLTKK